MWGDFAARGAVLKSFRHSHSSDIREQDWTEKPGTVLVPCSTDVALTTTGTDVALTTTGTDVALTTTGTDVALTTVLQVLMLH